MFGIKTCNTEKAHISKSAHSKLEIFLSVIIVIASLITIYGINKPHLYPFSKAIQLKYPTVFCREGDSRVIVDSHGKRLLICKANSKVSAVVDTQSAGSPLDRINGAVINNGVIYAFGSRQYHKGLFLASEAVVTYNLKGEYQKTLYEKVYKEEDFVISKSIKKLNTGNNAVFMTIAEGQKVLVYNISQNVKLIGTIELPEDIANCSYNYTDNSVSAVGKYSHCYYGNIYTGITEPITFGGIAKKAGELYGFDFGPFRMDTVDEYKSCPDFVFNEEGHAQFIFFVNQITGESVILSNGGQPVEIDSVCCSTLFLIKNLLFWFSAALLACVFIVLIIWLTVKKLSRKGLYVIVVLICILFTAIFYTLNESEQTERAYNKTLRTDAKKSSIIISKCWGSELSEISNSGIEAFCSDKRNREKLNEISDLLHDICITQGAEQPATIHILLFDKYKDDNYLHAFIGASTLISGEKISITRAALNQIKNTGGDKVLTITGGHDSFAYGIEPIYNNDEEIGAVIIADYRGNILHTCVTRALKLFLSFVTVMIGIYIFTDTCRTFGRNIKCMLKRDKTDCSGRAADMCGVLIFVSNVVFYIDSALVVYVAKSICINMSPTHQAFFLAMPISAFAAGALAGDLLYSPLMRKFGARKLYIIGTVFTIGALLLTSFSVNIANIYLYIICKFILGIFNDGILHMIIFSIPYDSKDESVQKGAFQSIIQATDGCAILMGLISGYVAQYISYSVLYLIPVFFAAVGCVIALCVFDRNKNSEQPKKNNAGTLSEHWKIYLKGPMIMYTICYCVPLIISKGYTGYLFPLYAASVELPPLLLSNISVFTRFLVYASGGIIDSITDKIKPVKALISPMLLVCTGLICFYLSPNIYWAVAMSFVFQLLWRAPKVQQNLYIKDIAESYGLMPQIVRANHQSVESSIDVFKSLFLASFVSLGECAACTAIGAICFAMVSLFAVYDRKKHLKT